MESWVGTKYLTFCSSYKVPTLFFFFFQIYKRDLSCAVNVSYNKRKIMTIINTEKYCDNLISFSVQSNYNLKNTVNIRFLECFFFLERKEFLSLVDINCLPLSVHSPVFCFRNNSPMSCLMFILTWWGGGHYICRYFTPSDSWFTWSNSEIH